MSETEFLRQLFNHVPKNIQHALLLTCAEKTPDNMEHSTLMLLLFNKFPETIVKYGVTNKSLVIHLIIRALLFLSC